nr:hypothetical protein [Tanacetum cinerariifolium]
PRRRDAAYLQAEEYDLMAAAADLDEIKEVNANCILMANLQQASTSSTQTDSAPIYDSDRSVELHENFDDNDVIYEDTSVERTALPSNCDENCDDNDSDRHHSRLLKRSSILSYSNPFLNHTKYHRMIMMLSLRILVWNKVGK